MNTHDRAGFGSAGLAAHRIVRRLGLTAALVLVGCALVQPRDEPTRFYLLASPPPAGSQAGAAEGRRWRLGLEPVTVPEYLRGRSIAVRNGVSEIRYAEFDRWAESLPAGITRVFGQALGTAGNVEWVTLDPGLGAVPDYRVTVRIRSCEGVRGEGGSGSIGFTAHWEFRPVGARLPDGGVGGFTNAPMAWRPADYGELAQRLGEAITAAAGALAEGLPRVARADVNPAR